VFFSKSAFVKEKLGVLKACHGQNDKHGRGFSVIGMNLFWVKYIDIKVKKQ